uniref:DDRGK domain-containing protein 1 n=1 Tax=Lygus hesperus TaxID=30085 RepID=A0A0A9W3J4_LYGHE
MDLNMILIFAGVTAVILVFLLFLLLKPSSGAKDGPEDEGGAVAHGQRRAAPRGAGAARARLRTGPQAAAQARQAAPVEDRDGDDDDDVEVKKMGAKKAAKLEAKAERKAQREAEEREREEKKKKKDQADEERKKQEEKELLEEKKKQEEERRAKEEEERREHEAYLKLKAEFTIEEEGCDQEELDGENLLERFIQYIQDKKVVAIDELAAKFRMKTQAAIDRIQDLQNEERLSGVIDDRGKFIYISRSELEGIAKFVKQRGRVSLVELAENSNRLMNLTPKIPVET